MGTILFGSGLPPAETYRVVLHEAGEKPAHPLAVASLLSMAEGKAALPLQSSSSITIQLSSLY